MLRTDRKIIAFLLFEAGALTALALLATSAVDEFRDFDPLGYLPAFAVVQAGAVCALLTLGGLTSGWGLLRLRVLVAAKRVARTFQHA